MSTDPAHDPTRPLAVLWLSDGKPGHYSLAEAIVAAIGRTRPIDLRRQEVTRPRWLPPRVLSALTNTDLGGRARMRLARLLGLDLATTRAPDVVVSAGGDTLLANVLAARHFGCANVFYGSLRRYREADFALVLTSYAEHAGADRPRTAMTLKPSARDPDLAPVPPMPASGRPTIAILAGGDSGTVRFGAGDWERLMALVADLAGVADVRVANSRRTPETISDRLLALVAGGAGDAAGRITVLDVRTAGPGTLGPMLAGCHAILATVDSSSMISEGVWLRRPVVTLAPEFAMLPPLEQGYRAWMAAQGWTASLALADASPATIMAAAATLKPLASNPLDDLAALLQERLPLADES
jgi:mitochondrial fission protein ELM1